MKKPKLTPEQEEAIRVAELREAELNPPPIKFESKEYKDYVLGLVIEVFNEAKVKTPNLETYAVTPTISKDYIYVDKWYKEDYEDEEEEAERIKWLRIAVYNKELTDCIFYIKDGTKKSNKWTGYYNGDELLSRLEKILINHGRH